MAEDIKAISPSGIVHNTTKIGTQDGQLEDCVNLRFKDGSWRAAGEGKIINETGNIDYSQVHIHTNIYRHVLGVKTVSGVSSLYWFGNLTPKEDTADVTKELFEFEAITPAKLTDVVGNVNITQNGHLITVIDEADEFEYFVYKTNVGKYIEVKVDANGKKEDRQMFPFGGVHFNWSTKIDKDHVSGYYLYEGSNPIGGGTDHVKIATSELTKKNKFTHPVLVCAALELYDGSFVFASNPILINPGENGNAEGVYAHNKTYPVFKSSENSANGITFDHVENSPNIPTKNDILSHSDGAILYADWSENDVFFKGDSKLYYNGSDFTVDTFSSNCVYGRKSANFLNIVGYGKSTTWAESIGVMPSLHVYGYVLGYDIIASLENSSVIRENKDIFTSLCIFVSREIDSYEIESGDSAGVVPYENAKTYMYTAGRKMGDGTSGSTVYCRYARQKNKNISDIDYDIKNSQFYLLKRYNVSELSVLDSNPIIDLSGIENNGLLNAINSGAEDYTKLTSEAFDRSTVLPKYAYSYNGRLHICNYSKSQFHGYTIDSFNLNNHSLSVDNESTYRGVLKNLKSDEDSKYQVARTLLSINSDASLVSNEAPAIAIVVDIETDNGTQKVVRYIKAGSTSPTGSIEDLDSFLTFPDARAKYMYLYYVVGKNTNGFYTLRIKRLKLKPHSYLNFAYYLNGNMRPIKWTEFSAATSTDLTTPIGPSWTPDDSYEDGEIIPN